MRIISSICLWLFLSISCAAVSERAHAESQYEIIADVKTPNVKRSVDVRLDEKVSVEVLNEMAEEIKNMDPQRYERTFIGYYLPGMEVDAGAWATANSDPDLKIKILGLTAGEEEDVARQAVSTPRDVIGIWMDDRPYVGGTITIYRENSRLYMESKYKDGSHSTEELIESKSADGARFSVKGDNSHGEYFILREKGGLEAGDQDHGVFFEFKRIK